MSDGYDEATLPTHPVARVLITCQLLPVLPILPLDLGLLTSLLDFALTLLPDLMLLGARLHNINTHYNTLNF